ncbi:unnamed protein product [Orchesella dallaii]|uniref:receptor protein-tyrosine kinase n=1 Tax=Orchesella dallaii TaxID=48710 RepID=A0ABP1QMS8_9HEXA
MNKLDFASFLMLFVAIQLFSLFKFTKGENVASTSANSERVDIIYNTSLTSAFNKLDNGVLQFIGNNASTITISCEYTKNKPSFTGWMYYGTQTRKIMSESMKPGGDENGMIINLSYGPPIIAMECYLKEHNTISNRTLIYTGKNVPPYLYKHGEMLRAFLYDENTAYFPCLLNYPLDNTIHQLQLFKDGERVDVSEYTPQLGFKLDISDVEAAFGVYQCKVTNSTPQDFTSVLLDYGAFISITPTEYSDMYVYAGANVTFECKLPINKFENEFIWYYEWKNGTQEVAQTERIDNKVRGDSYWELVKVTFPDAGIKSFVCAGRDKNSQTYYNGSLYVHIRQPQVPNILNKNDLPIIYNKGENVKLRCITSADPYQFKWFKNGMEVIGELKEEENGTQKLSFLLLNQPDFIEAKYTCNVYNSFGPPANHTFTVYRYQQNYTIYFIVIACLITASLFALILFTRDQDERDEINEKILKEFYEGNPTSEFDDADVWKYVSLGYNHDSEIPFKDIKGIKKGRVLGEGNFGKVIQGKARIGKGKKIPVAIKIPRLSEVSLSEKDELFSKFLAEIKLIQYLGNFHNHVVAFVGANTKRLKHFVAYLIVEYCAGGDLHTYLRKFTTNPTDKYYFIGENKSNQNVERNQVILDTDRLTLWCAQIANGMGYISYKGLVHRDLAARNILLGYPKNWPVSDRIEYDPEKLVAKIGDFGLTRGKTDGNSFYYPQVGVNESRISRRIPIHWYSPEALRTNKFSTKSDVWSFGVTVWEIFTLCETEPFSDNIQQFIRQDLITNIEQYLLMRGSLTKPPHAPTKLWDVIEPCFNINPDDRPDFNTLYKQLIELVDPKIMNIHKQGRPTVSKYAKLTNVKEDNVFLNL